MCYEIGTVLCELFKCIGKMIIIIINCICCVCDEIDEICY